MREAKLLYRSLAWRTITLARLRATDASGIKLSDPLLLPSDIGPPMGVQPNVISERNEKKKNPKIQKSKKQKHGRNRGWRAGGKELVVSLIPRVVERACGGRCVAGRACALVAHAVRGGMVYGAIIPKPKSIFKFPASIHQRTKVG